MRTGQPLRHVSARDVVIGLHLRSKMASCRQGERPREVMALLSPFQGLSLVKYLFYPPAPRKTGYTSMTHPANDPVATCTIQSRVQISRLNDDLPGKYNAATSAPDDVAVVEDTNPAPCASSETTFRRTASAAMTSSVCACSELSFEDPTAMTRECRHGRQTPIVRVVSASLRRAGPARQVELVSEISSSRRVSIRTFAQSECAN